jgi:hypothetical protein
MQGTARIHKSNSASLVSEGKEKSHSSHGAIHEIHRQSRPGESAILPNAAIEAIVGPRKAWLQMLHERNSEILNTYKEMFWFLPPFCMFPLELAQQSFVGYIECQQRITESIGQQIKDANLSARRTERTHSEVSVPVTSIEHGMDIAIGAEGNPWDEEKEAA